MEDGRQESPKQDTQQVAVQMKQGLWAKPHFLPAPPIVDECEQLVGEAVENEKFYRLVSERSCVINYNTPMTTITRQAARHWN